MSCNEFSHSRVLIDVLADDSDRPVGNMSAKILRITLTPVRLAGSAIATAMWEAIIVLTDSFGANVLTKMLCFAWEACSSWPTATGNCRVLQERWREPRWVRHNPRALLGPGRERANVCTKT